MRSKLYFASMNSDMNIIEELKHHIQAILNIQAYYHGEIPIPKAAFNPTRSQYNSTSILSYLRKIAINKRIEYMIGITSLDLYASSLNFVFGEAELNGKVAVVSHYRLNKSSKKLIIERLIKEIVHEFGHIVGLDHCTIPRCVMTFSNSILDTDNKSNTFCLDCHEEYRELLR